MIFLGILAIVVAGGLIQNLFLYWAESQVDPNEPYPVKGVDVSEHQKDIDWKGLASEDIGFAFIKATEGSLSLIHILLNMQKNDRDKYLEFYKNFGLQLKYGLYDSYGANAETLKDLVMFHSSSEHALVTLEEYVSRMKEDQKYIFFASGESLDKIDKLPQTELLKDKGYEILYLTDNIDEFALQVLHAYNEKEFKSVSADDLDLGETTEEKEQAEKQAEESKDLLEAMKDALGDKVTDVKLTQRLKSHPVCLTSKGGLSIEMEKVLNSMPTDQKVQAERVLEINAQHPILETLQEKYVADKDSIAEYAKLLYDQALLIEGLPIDDPVAFSNAVCKLMTK